MWQPVDDQPLDLITRLTEQRGDEPGIAVAVLRGGAVVARRYVGLARLEDRIPIGPDTRFHIVSVSKTFTAAAVLLLAARGALGLDEDIRRYLPDLPPTSGVTIRQLLSMTSGLRDVLEIARLRGIWTASPSRTRELLDLAWRQRTVSAPPGAQYMYANVNFLLLDALISQVSGMPADAFRRATLYEPLGLTATTERRHDGVVIPDLADPYVPDARGGWSRATYLLGIAADPVVTTLGDLTRWLLTLRSGTIRGVGVTAAMAERTRVRDGTEVYYGLGLAVRRYRGLTVLCHTGTQPGWKAHIAYVPARDLGVVVLSNRDDTQPPVVTASILSALIGDDFPRPHPGEDRTQCSSLTGTQLAAVPGSYLDPDAGDWVALTVDDGILRGETLGDPLVLYDEGPGVFRDGDDYRATVPAHLRIEFGSSPDEVSCRLNLGGQHLVLGKCRPPRYAATALDAFTGRYENQDIGSEHVVRVQDGQVWIDYGRAGAGGFRFPMDPIAPDAFLVRPRAPGVAYRHLFRFERDSAETVVSTVVTMERLKGMRLWRT